MILAALFLTSLTPLLANDPANESAERTFSTHDLASIASRHEEERPSTWLLPYFRPHQSLEGWWNPEEPMELLVDDLHNIISVMFEDEFEFEGRSIDLLDNGVLLVGGPPALHAKVSEALVLLDSILNSRVELTVDFFSLSGDGVRNAPALPSSGELTGEQARALAAQLSSTHQHRSMVLQVRADEEMIVDATRECSILRDYDIEIAQGTSIHDPVVDTASFGTRLGIRATPSKAGLALAVNLHRGDLIGGIQEQSLGLGREMTSDSGVRTNSSPAMVHSFDLANRSLALNTLLRDGHALAFSSRVEVNGGSAQDIVLIRKTGGAIPLMKRGKIGRKGLSVAFLNTRALLPPQLVAEGPLLSHMSFVSGMRTVWQQSKSRPYRPSLTTRLAQLDSDSPMNYLLGDVEQVQVMEYGPWRMISVPPDADREAANAELTAGLAAYESMMGKEELIQVTIALRTDGNSEKRPARATLPIRLGASSLCVLGVESLATIDYDVEVAQYSSAPDPTSASLFDGLALALTPRRTPSGKLSVDIRGGAHLERHRARTDLGSTLIDWLDQRNFDQLIINQEVLFDTSKGSQTISLGSAGAGSTEGLLLEITIRQ